MIASKVSLFPYTFLDPSRIAWISAFFEKIIVYRLPRVQSGPENEPPASAAVRDRLDFEEVTFFENKAELGAVLADFQAWAGQFGDPNYLSLLKGQLMEEKEEPPSKLMESIRGRRQTTPQPDREAQIFLHFAEEFDRQRGEIDDLVAKAMRKESLLGELVGVESAGDEFDMMPPGGALKPGDAAGDEMMPKRLVAWGRFYKKFGPSGPPLVTDHPEAIAVLDINLARRFRTHGAAFGRSTEIIEPIFELSLEENIDPTPIWPELSSFVDRLASRSWPKEELESLRQEAESLIQSVNGVVPGDKSGRKPSLRAYFLPGRDIKEAFSAAVDLAPLPPSLDVFSGPVFEVRRESTD